MSAWFWGHIGAIGTALSRLIRHPFATFFEVLVLGIALSLPVGLVLVVETVRTTAARLPSEPEMSLFVERDTRPGAVEALAKRLRALPDVRQVTFIARQDAAEQLRKSAVMAEVLDALPDNPLPDAFTLRLATRDPTRLDALRAMLMEWPGVEIVQADSGWARKMEAGIRVAYSTALLLGILFGMAALTVTFNTVRLQMLGRRDEIQLSRLIGATDAFVRRPFVYFGALQGMLGGSAALAIVASAYHALADPLTSFSMAYGLSVGLPRVLPAWAVAFLGGTAALGAAAAWVAATRHLWARNLRHTGL